MKLENSESLWASLERHNLWCLLRQRDYSTYRRRHILKCFPIFFWALNYREEGGSSKKIRDFHFHPRRSQIFEPLWKQFLQSDFILIRSSSSFFKLGESIKWWRERDTSPWRSERKITPNEHTFESQKKKMFSHFARKKVWSIKSECRWEGTPFNDGDIVKRQLILYSTRVFPKRKLPSRTTPISAGQAARSKSSKVSRKVRKVARRKPRSQIFFLLQTFTSKVSSLRVWVRRQGSSSLSLQISDPEDTLRCSQIDNRHKIIFLLGKTVN